MPLTFNPASLRIGIVGLGDVSLPLAVEFARVSPVVGFGVNPSRIDELRRGECATREFDPADLRSVTLVRDSAPTQGSQRPRTGRLCISTPADLAACNVFIVTGPTPIDRYKRPDLTSLVRASETLGKVLKRGDVVIDESNVYSGATEEDCVPVLEKHFGCWRGNLRDRPHFRMACGRRASDPRMERLLLDVPRITHEKLGPPFSRGSSLKTWVVLAHASIELNRRGGYLCKN